MLGNSASCARSDLGLFRSARAKSSQPITAQIRRPIFCSQLLGPHASSAIDPAPVTHAWPGAPHAASLSRLTSRAFQRYARRGEVSFCDERSTRVNRSTNPRRKGGKGPGDFFVFCSDATAKTQRHASSSRATDARERLDDRLVLRSPHPVGRLLAGSVRDSPAPAGTHPRATSRACQRC